MERLTCIEDAELLPNRAELGMPEPGPANDTRSSHSDVRSNLTKICTYLMTFGEQYYFNI